MTASPFFSFPHSRSLALLIPPFCLRRDQDLGIGDTTALKDLIEWAANHGISLIQLLPVNEAGPDNSPYNAISSVALDPIYLDVSPGAIPEVSESDFLQALAQADAARPEPLVDYSAVRDRKLHLLAAAHGQWLSADRTSQRWRQFAAFRQAEAAWLEDFCVFKFAMQQAGHERWEEWPEEYRDPNRLRGEISKLTEDQQDATLGFYAWLQWLAAEQWGGVKKAAQGHGLRLMGDIPIGVSRFSADVFFHQHLFDLNWCGGSPPEPAFRDDPFTQHWGQNWGIPLYRWLIHEQENFGWWRQRVRKCCEIFDVFRIDHILGFYRLYAFPWRPTANANFTWLSHEEAAQRTGGRLPRFFEHDDHTPESRGWNLEHGDWLLRMVKNAVPGAEVIGEDLGTVPPYVRPHLAELGIAGFKIPQWEESPHFPELSFATYATHDHPPLRLLWESAAAHGGEELWRLGRFAGLNLEQGIPAWSEEVQWCLLSALLQSPARHAAVMPTDLFGLTDRFNVPGTVGGSNWRLRLPWPVRQWNVIPELAAAAQRLADLSASSHRSFPVSSPSVGTNIAT